MPKQPEIPVRITGDHSDLRRAFRSAGADAAEFKARVARNAAMIRRAVSVVAAGGVVAAGTRIVRSAVQQAKEIENLSNIAGIGAEQFQKYAAGADTVGISQEKLADVLKDVNDKFGDFAANRAGPLKDFFDNIAGKVGVTADQFARLSGPEALQLYVSSLEKAGVSQQQMTFYMEALASDATALLPLLRDNGAGLKRLGEQAQEAGGVIDEALIRRGSEIADKWDQIMNSMVRSTYQFALQAAEMFDNAFGFTDSGRLEMKKDQLQKVGQEYVDAMKVVVTSKRKIDAEQKRISDNDLAGAAGISGAASSARLKALENEIALSKAAMAASKEEQESLKAQIAEIEKLKTERAERLSALAGGVDPINSGSRPKSGGGAGGSRSTTDLERLADQWKTKVQLLKEQQEKELLIVQNARERGLLGEQRYQEMLTRLSKEHADQRAQINRLEAASRVNTVLGAGEDVLTAMGGFNDRALRMAQVFGTAQALISTYQGAAEALKLPFPANLAASAAVVAKGLGFVAAISSVGKGSTSAPTGGGGGSAAAAQQPLSVYLPQIEPTAMYSGSTISKLFDYLTKEAGDRGIRPVWAG